MSTNVITPKEAEEVVSLYYIINMKRGTTLENVTRDGNDLVFTYDEVDEFIGTRAWPLQVEWASNFELGLEEDCARAGRELRDFCHRCEDILAADTTLQERRYEAMIPLYVLEHRRAKEVV